LHNDRKDTCCLYAIGTDPCSYFILVIQAPSHIAPDSTKPLSFVAWTAGYWNQYMTGTSTRNIPTELDTRGFLIRYLSSVGIMYTRGPLCQLDIGIDSDIVTWGPRSREIYRTLRGTIAVPGDFCGAPHPYVWCLWIS